MADNFRLNVIPEYSESSDYSTLESIPSFPQFNLTPDEVFGYKVEADTGGTTVECGTFSDLTCVVLVNTDSTNFVDVTYGTD